MQGRKLLRLLLLFLPCENKCQESVAHWFGINNEIPCHCLFAFARALTSLDTTGGLKEESRKKHGTLFFFYFFMRICVSIPVSTCSANNENEEVHHGSILADVVATGDMTTTVKETRREDLPFTRFSHSSPSSSPFVILFFFLFRWGRPRVCVWINNRFFIFLLWCLGSFRVWGDPDDVITRVHIVWCLRVLRVCKFVIHSILLLLPYVDGPFADESRQFLYRTNGRRRERRRW